MSSSSKTCQPAPTPKTGSAKNAGLRPSSSRKSRPPIELVAERITDSLSSPFPQRKLSSSAVRSELTLAKSIAFATDENDSPSATFSVILQFSIFFISIHDPSGADTDVSRRVSARTYSWSVFQLTEGLIFLFRRNFQRLIRDFKSPT